LMSCNATGMFKLIILMKVLTARFDYDTPIEETVSYLGALIMLISRCKHYTM